MERRMGETEIEDMGLHFLIDIDANITNRLQEVTAQQFSLYN